MNNTLSPAFITWMAHRRRCKGLTEPEYDQALLEAEVLKQRNLVTELEWINMVKTANYLLTQPHTET